MTGAVAVAATVAFALPLAGCRTRGPIASPGGPLRIVAAESMWGSIAAQLAGTHGRVQSIVGDPAQDPHAFEPAAEDARLQATAQLTIINGLKYDPWAPRLAAANGTPADRLLDVGALLHLSPGANPHRWYDLGDVSAVARAITRRLQRLDPPNAAYFALRARGFRQQGLNRLGALEAAIRDRYRGTAIGGSETIVAPWANGLGLRLLTPPGFMTATSEGGELTAGDISATEAQIAGRRIAVWIYNAQNSTPEVERCNALARRAGVPVVTVTETLSPRGASFVDWQARELQALQRALREARR
jgi:zinc/manganese transport system substrate-binding protein